MSRRRAASAWEVLPVHQARLGARSAVATVCAAVLLPLAWLLLAQVTRPSDGTSVPPTGVVHPAGQGTGLRVDDAAVGAPLKRGDVVVAVDGVPVADLVTRPGHAIHAGQRLTYRVIREGRVVDVPARLTRSWPGAQIAAQWKVYLVPAVLLAVASFVYLRRPGDRAAQLMLAVGGLLTAGTESSPLGPHLADLIGGRAVWPFVGSEIANALMWAALLHFALVFPTPSSILRRRPRIVAAVYALPFVLYGVAVLYRTATTASALDRLGVRLSVSRPAGQVIPVLVAVLLVLGYRRSPDLVTRRYMRWVVVSVAGASVLYAGLGQLPAALDGRPLIGWDWLELAFVAGPIAIAAAVLRYQLFDIQVILKRSLVSVIVAAGLLAAAVWTLVTLSEWLPHRAGLVAMLAGGAGALLFRPAHDRLQRLASRWAYGSRDDPYEVVTRITELDPAGEPSALLAQVTATLVSTLRLSYAAISWVRDDGTTELAASTGAPDGTVETLPLTRGSTVVGRLALCVPAGREPFGPADRRLLDGIGAQVSRVADLVLLNAALQRSREHLVTAREEERRRLHRDLHDGIGPSLAAQAMQIDVARLLLAENPAATEELLADIAASTGHLIADVRRVVDDLRPAALDHLGLISAIREKAAVFTAARDRAGLEISVQSSGDFGHLPAAVEVAAYRIATEALTNVVRHSQATRCRITLATDAQTFVIRVEDDGVGIDATYRPGVGIASMRERAHELGGQFEIAAPPAGGNLLTARLPVTVAGPRS